jgi:YidC/Oxa1 family membrane protein insertase
MNPLSPVIQALGKLFYFIYDKMVFENYGLAIILFTIFIRLILLPLTVKQYKSSARMQEVQPKIQEVQKRYKNDKEKLNQELMKLYSEEKINPAGGCLPLLIQMPILLSLWQVISYPLENMKGYTRNMVEAMWNELPKNFIHKIPQYHDLSVANYTGALNSDTLIHNDKLNHLLNMEFLNINLGIIPTYDFGKIGQLLSVGDFTLIFILIFPILAVITTYITTKLSMATAKPQDGPGAGMMNSMLYVGPLMTLIFSFQMPAGMALYWIVGNLASIAQQWYIKNHITHKKEVKK